MESSRPTNSLLLPASWAFGCVALWVAFALLEAPTRLHSLATVIAATLVFLGLTAAIGMVLLGGRKVNPPTQQVTLQAAIGMNQPGFPSATDFSDLAAQLFFVWIFRPPSHTQSRQRWWTLVTILGWPIIVLGSFALSALLAILAGTQVRFLLPWTVLGLSFGMLTAPALSWFLSKSIPK